MPGNTRFWIALSISVILHGLVLYVVNPEDYSITREITPTDTLQISLRSPPPIEFDESSQPEEPVAELTEPLPQTPQQISVPEIVDVPESTPGEEDQEQDSAPGFKEPLPSLITAFVKQERIDAYAASIDHGCTLSQRASRVRICAPDDDDLTRRLTAYEGMFSYAFRPQSSVSSIFQRDMDNLESLMRKQEALAAIEPLDALEAALLVQEQRDIRAEIFRIDSKYAQVNLLKLIPMGANLVKKLWAAARSKN